MQHDIQMRRLFAGFTCSLLILLPSSGTLAKDEINPPKSDNCQRNQSSPNFLVVGGGGAPYYNEIALEKNVLYFQRTLQFMGYNPQQVSSIFFANGNDGQASIRYINPQGQEQFKPPEIPNLKGATTFSNIQSYFQQLAQQQNSKRHFYTSQDMEEKINKI